MSDATSATALVDWIDAPRGDAGIHVLGPEDWSRHPYPDVAARVRGTAARLVDAGVRPGDAVGVVDLDCLGFIVGFFAALYAGGTPLPLPPRSPRPASYVEDLAAILEAGAPAIVLTGPETEEPARTAAASGSLPVLVADDARTGGGSQAPSAEIALLQFTSGSTGRPRGVRVTAANITAHAAMARRWLEWGPDDAAASWLPLHHDMGLIGLMITSVVGQSDLWQMRPEQFLWQPHRWVRCFDRGGAGAAITAAPTFGYGYAARRVDPAHLEGTDLSALRSAVVGAERLVPTPLAAFVDLLKPHGLRPTALRPAFGLAEATLAVTGTPPSAPPHMVRIDWSTIRDGDAIPATALEPLSADDDADGGALLSCGAALDPLSVAIHDEEERPLPDGVLGEIVVDGPTVAAGYDGAVASSTTRFVDGRLHTGDAGFLLGGELFVVGRIADSIKVRGQRVFAENVEEQVTAQTGVAAHRCLVVPLPGVDGDGLAVLLEDERAPELASAATRAVRALVGPTVDVTVFALERDTIARTTSGKPRRRRMWQQLAAGELDGRAVALTGAGAPPAT
jgi:acyl-CoA synthetase (AMP-forming)/AMP-acid ligase II